MNNQTQDTPTTLGGKWHFLGAFLVATVLMVGPTLAADEAGARAFIRELGDKSIEQLTNKSLTEAELTRRFEDLYRKNFDTPSIASFVMGRNWRRMTEEQRAEFVALFDKFVVASYANQFRKYQGETFAITGVNRQKDNIFLVLGHVGREGQTPVQVEWRVGARDGIYRLYDISVEGVSMAITQRSEFSSVVKNQGGIEGLMSTLRQRTSSP